MNEIIIKEHTIYDDMLANRSLTVIDLGACRGEFINEIDNRYTVKKAIAVEPNITNFNVLMQRDNFILLNKAVVGTDIKSVMFREDVESPYNGSLVFGYFSNFKTYEVETTTLSELIELMNEDTDIDLLKIDIEGSEYDILLNSKDSDLLKFKQITVEFHDFVDPNFKDKNKH
jgi:FkbM family methyltransferase